MIALPTAGLVTRSGHPDDHRVVRVELTERGSLVLAELTAEHKEELKHSASTTATGARTFRRADTRGTSTGRRAGRERPGVQSLSGRRVGKSTTSRIDGVSVSSITRRSMPMPRPPVGGRPYSRARR